MSADDALFSVEPVEPAALDGLSADQRRTRRQAAALAAGGHPLGMVLSTGLGLHEDAAPADDRTAPGLRCGTCRWRQRLGYHDRAYTKCTFGAPDGRPWDGPRVSNGSGTDCRAWWPACRDYQPADPADPRGTR